MKRPVKRTNKVRVNITIDEDIFILSGEYIQNLSGFINKTLKNYIEIQKLKEFQKQNDDNIRYVKKESNMLTKQKKIDYVEDEPIDENFKWW